jgi:hypothetical protein
MNTRQMDIISWLACTTVACLELASQNLVRQVVWAPLIETLRLILVETSHLGQNGFSALLDRAQVCWTDIQIAEATLLAAERTYDTMASISDSKTRGSTLADDLMQLYNAMSAWASISLDRHSGAIALRTRLLWLRSREFEHVRKQSEKSSEAIQQCAELLQSAQLKTDIIVPYTTVAINVDSVQRESIRLQSKSFFLECEAFYSESCFNDVVRRLAPVVGLEGLF